MRFLIDRCAGARLAKALRDGGHDVLDAGDAARDPGDAELLAIADAEKRILVTIDKDFGLLVFAGGIAHHGVVRLPDCPGRDRILLMQKILSEHSADLEARAVITVSTSRVRISRSKAQ